MQGNHRKGYSNRYTQKCIINKNRITKTSITEESRINKTREKNPESKKMN